LVQRHFKPLVCSCCFHLPEKKAGFHRQEIADTVLACYIPLVKNGGVGESITLKVPKDIVITKVEIANITGQLIKEINNPKSTFSTGKMQSGVYIISLITEEGIIKTERIIKR
jgi:hypothetical protein